MARRSKNLKNSLQYVLTQSSKIGVSKRAEALNGIDNSLYIYSVNRLDAMRDFASNFSRYMKKNFPEIRQVKDLDVKHFKDYVHDCGAQWSPATCAEYEGRIRKLGRMVSRVYGLNKDFSMDIQPKQQEKTTGRDRMMSDKHVTQLREKLEKGESAAKWVPAISSTIGARSEEIRSIDLQDIDLKNKVVHLRNCKNGRNRDVRIPEKYLGLYAQIADHMRSNGWKTVCNGMGEKAVNAALRRAMKAIGISELYPRSSNHAIRKNYATRRYLEEREKGLSQKEAFTIVCKELGHNSYRSSLFNVYVQDPDHSN